METAKIIVSRWRTLALLAAAAAFSLVLAGLALHRSEALTAPKYPPQRLFPGLAEQLSEAAKIRIDSKAYGRFEIAFQPMKGWVLPGRDDYPAAFVAVRRTLHALAAMQTVEPKTARREWFRYIGLDDPPEGTGSLITVTDGTGKVLARLIVGKSEDIGDPSGAVGLYVRKPGEAQSWLVKSPADLPLSPDDWMERDIVGIDRGEIAEVSFRPASGPAFVVRRTGPNGGDFALDAPPKGRPPAPGALDAAGSVLADFAFEAVEPRKDIDFEDGAARVVTRTFDGLIVGVDVVHANGTYWARISAGAAPGHADAARRAGTVNAKTFGWAYRLSDSEGAQFMAARDSLLQKGQ